ncbi:hypothetical protein [uncultured Roseibium sp.]|uniref:hypothetical protein n=1 Tax=uncultured Roseibium sp. TaxID=1936171 RepID=UPI002631DFF6|nr:hypothetical protein [uncultured Roseibium sp.]
MGLFDFSPEQNGLFGSLRNVNERMTPFFQNNQNALMGAGLALMGGDGYSGAARGFMAGGLADGQRRSHALQSQMAQERLGMERSRLAIAQAEHKQRSTAAERMLGQQNKTQEWLAKNAPDLAGLPADQAFKIYSQRSKHQNPMSTVGKIQSDFNQGLISDDVYKASMEKAASKSGLRLETNPDGTFTFVQGDVSNLGRKATNQLETGAVADIQNLSDLHSIAELYSEEALTYQGQARGFANRQLDKVGLASPEGQEYLAQKTKFTNAVEQVFNQYRKEITGAAASVQELDRLKKSLLNTDMSPAEFRAAYGQFVEKLQRSLQIKLALKEQGIDQSDPRFGAVFDAEFMNSLGSSTSPSANSGVKDWTEVFGGQ